MNARALTVLTSVAFGCTREPSQAPMRTEERVSRPAATAPPPTAKTCESDRVRLLLSAPHDPPTRADLSAACEDPVPLLVTFASDTSSRGVLRLRAIEALGRFGGRSAKLTLEERATASGDLASVRRAALVALAEAAGDDPGLRERVGIHALTDADGHVRVAAARLLAGLRTPAATSALESARQQETESFVRSELDRTLAR